MSSPPQSHSPWRHPRAYLDGSHPTVLRFQDGQRLTGNLQVVSVTGGLLSLPKPLDLGSQVRLMFLTETGSVLGSAEMLPPVADKVQPFRFTTLPADDQRRVGALIHESTKGERAHDTTELDWIEKLRTARAAQRNHVPFWQFKLARGIGLLTIGTAIAAYVLHSGLLLYSGLLPNSGLLK
jgi:hypothetical protein